MELSYLVKRPDLAAATAGRVGLCSLAAPLTIERIDELLTIFGDHQARFGADQISITFIKPNIALPSDDIRSRVRELHASVFAAGTSCVICDADGFWAAAMRGILASLNLITRKAPRGTRTIDEALAFVTIKTPSLEAERGALAEAMERFRSEHLAMGGHAPQR